MSYNCLIHLRIVNVSFGDAMPWVGWKVAIKHGRIEEGNKEDLSCLVC